jgi:DNA-binding winged helix-turn-helix (wHTH) protein
VETEHFTVDLAAKRVTASKGEVHLTPTEWQIVELLVRNAGKLVTQRQLLQEVWGPQSEKETNYLRVYMAQIRSKLEPGPSRPRHFITEARMGYRFELEGVRQSAAAARPADPAEANRSRPGADVGVSLPGGRPGLEASAAWRVPSERDALEALERDLERLRREQRVARSLSLAELGERVPRAARR